MSYRVQYKTNLSDSAWADLIPEVAAIGPTANATDTNHVNTSCFYRLRILP